MLMDAIEQHRIFNTTQLFPALRNLGLEPMKPVLVSKPLEDLIDPQLVTEAKVRTQALISDTDQNVAETWDLYDRFRAAMAAACPDRLIIRLEPLDEGREAQPTTNFDSEKGVRD